MINFMVVNLEWVLVIVLMVLLVALFAVSYMKKKKFNTELSALRSELKKGDKVMTDSGIVGEVVDSYQEEEYTYFVLKTGKGENSGYVTVHGNAIYYVFGKDTAQNKQQKVVVKVAPNVEEKPQTPVEEKKD